MIEYNDNILANNQQYDNMRKAYQFSHNSDIFDLKQIAEKMKEQRESFRLENRANEYDEIIRKIDNDISDLDCIINISNRASNFSHKASNKNTLNRILSKHHISKQTTNQTMLNSSQIDNKIPIKKTTLFRRLSSRIYHNLSAINNRLRCRNKVPIHNDPLHNNQPNYPLTNYSIDLDSGLNVATMCEPRRQLYTNQLDIIRLLLLYMALRPNNHHCHRICNITLSQFEVLNTIAP